MVLVYHPLLLFLLHQEVVLTRNIRLFDKLDALHLVDLVAVEPHHQLWVDGFVVFGVIGNCEVVLLVFEVVDAALVGDDAVVDVFVVDEALFEVSLVLASVSVPAAGAVRILLV